MFHPIDTGQFKLVVLRPDRLNQKLIRNPDIRNRGALSNGIEHTISAAHWPLSTDLLGHSALTLGMALPTPERPLPCLCPNALPLKTATLGDKVGEILLFCRSSARHTVRPAGRFPIAGLGGAARVMPIWRK
jgi:hypothetical protein